MKKIISAVLVCVLLVGCIFALASCAKTLNGTYKTGSELLGGTYIFEGNKLTHIISTVGGLEKRTEGTYVISEDEEKGQIITITYPATKEGEEDTVVTYSLVEGIEGDKEYIKIDGVQYTKVEE